MSGDGRKGHGVAQCFYRCVPWLACLFLLGCVESNNRAPEIDSLPALVFDAEVLNQLEVGARDPDSDPLTFRYRFSPRPPSFDDNARSTPEIQAVTDGAIVRWMPSEADAGGVSGGVYVLTIIADDGRGGEAFSSVRLTVRLGEAERLQPFGFVEPSAQGVYTEGGMRLGYPR